VVSLNILFFNWRCWLNPEMGGAEVFTHEVAKGLTTAGHHVTLFTSTFPSCEHEEVIDGIRIVRRGGKIAVYQQAKRQYNKYFSKEHYDIIVDEINTVPFFAPQFVKNGEKVIALIHQLAREYWFYETHFPINYLGYHFFEKRWLKKYRDTTTLTVSESTKEDLQQLGLKKIHVIPEGLNFKPIEKTPEKSQFPTIVFSGRLKRAKRPDHLIKAFAAIKQRNPKAELWIIGDGIFRADLEKIGVNGVKFLGAVDNAQRRELIKKAWVLVNPSVREGFGLNIIEANALGTPCVAYDVPGLRDSVKNQETGLLAKAGSVEDLTTKINDVLEDESLREELSKAALIYSRSFSWENCTEHFLNVALMD
jgi:glycosyltransferase involved in cell wall biosynthesis